MLISYEFTDFFLIWAGYGNVYSNYRGIQLLAAYIMAINEINNKFDGIADHLLPNTTILLGYEQAQDSNFFWTVLGADYVLYDFNFNLDVCIGPNGNNAMQTAAEFFQTFKQLQIGFDSSASVFEDKKKYNNLARVCPDDSFSAYVIAKVICGKYNWKRVVTFSSTDSYGSYFLSQFQVYAKQFSIDIIGTYTFTTGENNFEPLISSAKGLGGYIFIFFMGAEDAGVLLEQGYDSGLFKEGTQVIGVNRMASPAIWQAMTYSADIKSILKGLIIPLATTTYDTPLGRQFVNRWRAQQYTGGYVQNGTTYCNMAQDDSHTNAYLYTYAGLCLGLNFSSFALDGSNIDPDVAYVYDATYAGAYAVHNLLYNKHINREQFTADLIMNTLVQNVSFAGLTGRVSFSPGVGYENSGLGDRASDHTYSIVNFNPKYFHRILGNGAGGMNGSTNTSGLVAALKWNSLSETFVPCRDCPSIIFNTHDNSVPYDRTPETIVKLTDAQKNIVFALGLLCFLEVLCFFVMIVWRRNDRIVKAAQPIMLHLILLGGLFGAAQVVLIVAEVTDTVCILQMWFAHICFGLCFSALVVKTWVVNKIVNSRMKRVKVRMTDALVNVTITIAILTAILFVVTFIGKPYLATSVTSDINKPLRYYYCAQKNPAISTILLVLEIVSLLVGLRLCWMIRNVPDALNESRYIVAGEIVF